MGQGFVMPYMAIRAETVLTGKTQPLVSHYTRVVNMSSHLLDDNNCGQKHEGQAGSPYLDTAVLVGGKWGSNRLQAPEPTLVGGVGGFLAQSDGKHDGWPGWMFPHTLIHQRAEQGAANRHSIPPDPRPMSVGLPLHTHQPKCEHQRALRAAKA